MSESEISEAPAQEETLVENEQDGDEIKSDNHQKSNTDDENDKYFMELMGSYENRNDNLMKHLETLYDRIEIMESTAPAMMIYSAFRGGDTNNNNNTTDNQICSDISLGYDQYVTRMATRAMAGERSITDHGIVPPPAICSKDEFGCEKGPSSDTMLIAQLKRLELLMVEEKTMKERVERIMDQEAEVKKVVVGFSRPEGQPDPDTQEKLESGKFGKVYVPLTDCSPELLDIADGLTNAIKAVEDCCSCRMVKIKGLKDTVNNITKVLRYCARHEDEWDKPDIPPAKHSLTEICPPTPKLPTPPPTPEPEPEPDPCDEYLRMYEEKQRELTRQANLLLNQNQNCQCSNNNISNYCSNNKQQAVMTHNKSAGCHSYVSDADVCSICAQLSEDISVCSCQSIVSRN